MNKFIKTIQAASLALLLFPFSVSFAATSEAQVRSAYDKLIKSMGMTRLSAPRLIISNVKTINAWYDYQSNTVTVTRDLMKISTPGGTAGILAHELGHYKHRNDVFNGGEIEADREGGKLVIKSGQNPCEMIEWYRMAMKKFGTPTDGVHPVWSKRIEILKKEAPWCRPGFMYDGVDKFIEPYMYSKKGRSQTIVDILYNNEF